MGLIGFFTRPCDRSSSANPRHTQISRQIGLPCISQAGRGQAGSAGCASSRGHRAGVSELWVSCVMLYMAEWHSAVATQHVQQERERQQRLKLKRKLKLKEQQQQQEKTAAVKRKLDPSGAHKRKAEPPGPPKLKRLVKKGAPERALPARGDSSDELEDLPLAKRIRRESTGHSRYA